MKIKDAETERIAFGQLNAGDVFELDGTSYMKIKTPRAPPSGWWTGARLQDGDLCYFRDDTLIRHFPNAFLTLE